MIDEEDDPRFNGGLFYDVCALLDSHGYTKAVEPRFMAQAFTALLHLTRAYEGKSEE